MGVGLRIPVSIATWLLLSWGFLPQHTASEGISCVSLLGWLSPLAHVCLRCAKDPDVAGISWFHDGISRKENLINPLGLGWSR